MNSRVVGQIVLIAPTTEEGRARAEAIVRGISENRAVGHVFGCACRFCAFDSSVPQNGVEMRPNMVATTEHLLDDIRLGVRTTGSQKKVAESLGISPQYLNDVLAGRREISEALAERLGYRRIVLYMSK